MTFFFPPMRVSLARSSRPIPSLSCARPPIALPPPLPPHLVQRRQGGPVGVEGVVVVVDEGLE